MKVVALRKVSVFFRMESINPAERKATLYVRMSLNEINEEEGRLTRQQAPTIREDTVRTSQKKDEQE